MNDNLQTLYDEVLYPNFCHRQTHPDRLAVIATLFGMNPAPVERCRVLELGCGDGGNLIAMAHGLENSQFVGVDLAARPVAIGQGAIEALRLSNIELRQASILDIGEEIGRFDYIIAHGVYSWVPEPVREKLLAICRERLKPEGVAFISYNTYPGGHLRNMMREMMLFHTRGLEKAQDKVDQGLALLRFIGESQTRPDEFRQLLKTEADQIGRYHKETIFHDDLATINTPLYFHQFMEQAQAQGLQYLGEADFYEMQDHIYTAKVSSTLHQLSGNRILREQYLDFLKCRRFRQTLLCHREAELELAPRAERVKEFYIASMAQAVSPNPDCRGTLIERFEGNNDSAMETDFPLAKAAIQILGEIWPATLAFGELLERASARLELPTMDSREEDATTLSEILLQTYATGLVDFHSHEPRHCRQVSERPLASPLARWQIRHGTAVTTLRHEAIRVADKLSQKLLTLLDGTRDRDMLVQAMSDFIRMEMSENGGQRDLKPLLANLENELVKNLEKLARMGMLLE
ncbi:MAG: class I SAM-dependent methyltransferase [Methylococcaceae bacterium]|nr:class I SAM-dependent methyltransferase [Methylococcaceae bacterium]